MTRFTDASRAGHALISEQRSSWLAGEHTPVEDFLRRNPLLHQQREVLQDLIFQEYCLRQEFGERPSPEEYFQRFPQLRSELEKLFAVDGALAESARVDNGGEDAVTDGKLAADASTKPADNQDSDPDKSCEDTARIALLDSGRGDDTPRLRPSNRVESGEGRSVTSRILGGYELLGELGRGGMGVVYKARHQKLGRLAAVKLIRASRFADAEDIQRFEQEAQAAAQLDHPAIVPLYEIGKDGDQHYMALALVEGKDLWTRIREAPLPPRDAAEILRRVAEGVQYAHERGIVHRDLKPQNILLTPEGQPRITDFGLAKRTDANSSLTATGQVMGTPSYMPPEQALGQAEQIGPAADVYSLGATLYCALTGRPPFQSATLVETLRQVVEQDPVPARQLNPAIERDLETICFKCLEKAPTRRYTTAGELSTDLQRFLRGEPIRARPINALNRGWRWCKRQPVIAGLGATLLLATVIATCLAIIANEQRQRAEAAIYEVQSARTEVDRERRTAVRERDAAKRERDQVTTLNESLRREQERQRSMLYASDLNLVPIAWGSQNFARIRDLLDAHRPKSGQTDLRGFEWHYWNRKLHSEIAAFSVPGLLAISPDASKYAARSKSGVTISDMQTRETICILAIPDEWFTGLDNLHSFWVRFDPSGKRVVIGVFDYDLGRAELQVFDAITGALVKSIHPPGPFGYMENADSLAFCAGGTRMAWINAASVGARVKTWDLSSGTEHFVDLPLDELATSVAFHPLQLKVAVFSVQFHDNFGFPSKSTLQIIDPTLPGEAIPLEVEYGAAKLCFSADGTKLAALVQEKLNGTFQLVVYEATTGRRLFAGQQDASSSIAPVFSSDGRWLAYTRHDGTMIQLVNASDGAAGPLLVGPTDGVRDLACSADSRRVYATSRSGTIRVWGLTEKDVTGPVTLAAAAALQIAIAKDGSRVASAGQSIPRVAAAGETDESAPRRNEITVRDATGRILQNIDNIDNGEVALPLQLSFSHDGSRLAVLTPPQSEQPAIAAIWESDSGRELRRVKFPMQNQDYARMAFSPLGDRIAITSTANVHTLSTSSTRIWDVDTSGEPLVLEGNWDNVSWSADGRWILGRRYQDDGSGRSRIALWDAASGRILWRLQGQIGHLAFSDDGSFVYGTISENEMWLKVWESSTGRELHRLQLPEQGYWTTYGATAMSRDGLTVAASSDKGVLIWNLTAAGFSTWNIKGIQSLTFTPDGQTLAVSVATTSQVEIKLYKVQTKAEVLSLATPQLASTVEFSSDGTQLVARSNSVTSDVILERWDATRVSPQIEALSMVESLLPDESNSPETFLASELIAPIETDARYPREIREAAIATVRKLPRPPQLICGAWNIAQLPNEPARRQERALAWIVEACLLEPNNPRAWRARALLQYRLGQLEEASAAIQELNRLRHMEVPRVAEELAIEALVAQGTGRTQKAKELHSLIRISTSRNERLLAQLLAEVEASLNIPAASTTPDEWIGHRFMPRTSATFVDNAGNHIQEPQLPFTVSKVAGDQLWCGESWISRLESIRVEDAAQYFTHVLALFPEMYDAYYRRGLVHETLGRDVEALADFAKAVELSEPRRTYFLAHARVRLRILHKNESLTAEEQIEQELGIRGECAAAFPGDTDYSLEFAVLLYWFGREEQHLAHCAKLLTKALESNDPLICDRAAKAYLIRSDAAENPELMKQAVTAARKSVEFGRALPLLPWFQMIDGVSAYRAGELAQADASLTAALEADTAPIQGIALCFRAMSAYKQGQRDKAMQDFAAAKVLLPPVPELRMVSDTNVQHDIIIFWLAFQEAEDLLETAAAQDEPQE